MALSSSSEIAREIFFSVVVFSVHFLIGVGFGFSSQVIPFLESSGDLKVNREGLYWIATCGVIFRPIGAISESFFVDFYGRRAVLRLSFLGSAIGWFIITFSFNLTLLLVGRCITSFASGVLAAPYIYVTEMSDPKHRAGLLSLAGIFLTLGVESIYVLNSMFYWKTSSGIITICCLISVIMSYTIPESFYWYVGKNRITEAKTSYKWVRKCDDETAQIKIRNIEELKSSQPVAERTSFFEDIKSVQVYKPLLISLVIHFLRAGLGMEVFQAYAVKIFSQLKTPYDNETLSIIFGLLNVIFAVLLCILCKRYNRRPLIFTTCFVMLISILLVIICESVTVRNVFLPLISLFCFCIYTMLAFIVNLLTFGVTSEILNSSRKGCIFALIAFFVYVMAAFYTQLYGKFGVYISLVWILSFSMINCLLIPVVVYFFVPETKNKSLEEIEKYFNKNPRNDKYQIIELLHNQERK